jgi:hypothetical protein
MKSAATERGREIRKRPAEDGKSQENPKKILNRGNEPKNLVITKDLAFFGAKNEPKTNSILRVIRGNCCEETSPAPATVEILLKGHSALSGARQALPLTGSGRQGRDGRQK